MDLKLLKACLNRGTFELLYPQIPQDLLSMSSVAVLKWLKAYYKTVQHAEQVSPEDLSNYVKVRNADTLEEEGVQLVLSLIDGLKRVPDESNASLYEAILEAKYAGQVAKVILKYQSGGEVDPIQEVSELSREFTMLRGGTEEAELDIYDVLQALENEEGITFDGVSIFEEFSKPFIEGDSILIAGDQGKGKTTLLSWLLPKALRSIHKLYGDSRPILWLVNEGAVRKIMPRIYQGGMGLTLTELYDLMHEGKVKEKFKEVVGYSPDLIKIIPFHGKTIQDLEMLVQKYNPSLVVTDMVEHVGGVRGESKSDVIGNIWARLRELALIYGYVNIGTMQISLEGKNQRFPAQTHLAYSKTAVQGYVDTILMMGDIEAEGMETTRFLSTPKTKSKVEGKTSYPKIEYNVDFDRCQFYETDRH